MFTILCASIDGVFSNPVTFSASGLPTGAAVTFPAVSGNLNIMGPMTITTTSRVEAGSALGGKPLGPASQPNFLELSAACLAALAIMTLLATRFAGIESRVRRRFVSLCLPILTIVVAGYIAGCGSASTAGNQMTNPNGTPAGNFAITVTATSGSDVHSTTVTLIVQ